MGLVFPHQAGSYLVAQVGVGVCGFGMMSNITWSCPIMQIYELDG